MDSACVGEPDHRDFNPLRPVPRRRRTQKGKRDRTELGITASPARLFFPLSRAALPHRPAQHALSFLPALAGVWRWLICPNCSSALEPIQEEGIHAEWL